MIKNNLKTLIVQEEQQKIAIFSRLTVKKIEVLKFRLEVSFQFGFGPQIK